MVIVLHPLYQNGLLSEKETETVREQLHKTVQKTSKDTPALCFDKLDVTISKYSDIPLSTFLTIPPNRIVLIVGQKDKDWHRNGFVKKSYLDSAQKFVSILEPSPHAPNIIIDKGIAFDGIILHPYYQSGALTKQDISFVKQRISDSLKTIRHKTNFTNFSRIDVTLGGANELGRSMIQHNFIVGGFAADTNNMMLWTYAKNKKWRTSDHITATFSHEANHIARNRSGHTLLCSFGERLILEGLAQTFEEELGYEPKFRPYATHLTKDELTTAEEIARILVKDGRKINSNLFFFGNKDRGIKLWTGYSLGYGLVKSWLEKNSIKSSEAVGVDTEEMLRPWINGNFKATDCYPSPK